MHVQNQVGPHPTKWDKTGIVTEVRQFDQYLVRVDGSGRLTLRNRKFLRRFVPMKPQRIPVSVADDDIPLRSPSPFTRIAPQAMLHSSTPSTPPAVTPVATIPEPPPTPLQPPILITSDTSEHIDRDTSEHIAPFPHAALEHGDRPVQHMEAPLRMPQQRNKKAPLALRRLASYNTEGRKGLGEYKPDPNSDS